jgi:hypothetical protein
MRNQCAINAQSMRNRYAIATQSMHNQCAIDTQSIRNCFSFRYSSHLDLLPPSTISSPILSPFTSSLSYFCSSRLAESELELQKSLSLAKFMKDEEKARRLSMQLKELQKGKPKYKGRIVPTSDQVNLLPSFCLPFFISRSLPPHSCPSDSRLTHSLIASLVNSISHPTLHHFTAGRRGDTLSHPRHGQALRRVFRRV